MSHVQVVPQLEPLASTDFNMVHLSAFLSTLVFFSYILLVAHKSIFWDCVYMIHIALKLSLIMRFLSDCIYEALSCQHRETSVT